MSWLLDTDVICQPAKRKARRHNLSIVTGHDKEFRRPGIKVFNPFKEDAPSLE